MVNARLSDFFKGTVVALSAWSVAAYAWVTLFRLGYPYQLEWLEGALADETLRVLEGKSLYGPPSLDFLPFFYTPLYFFVSAAFSKITGDGFLPLRLVSVLSSIGFLGLIGWLVKKETGKTYFAFLAAFLMAATYKVCGSWFDMARLDSFFLFLTLAGICLIRFGHSQGAAAAAGSCVFLAFFTKQTALVLFAPLAVYVLLRRRRQAAFFFGSFAVCFTLSTWLMNRFSGGWYSYYVFDLPRRHSGILVQERFLSFWTQDLGGVLPVACVLSAVFLVRLARRDGDKALFYALTLAGMLAGSWITRLHDGGSSNVLMPAFAALSVLFGMAAADFTSRGGFVAAAVLGLCLIQSLSLAYSPKQRIPKKIDYENGRRVVDAIGAVRGQVYAPRFGYLPRLAHKKTYAHRAAMDDVVRSDALWGARLCEEMKQAIGERRFQAIFLDAFVFESCNFQDAIDSQYEAVSPPQLKETKFWGEKDVSFLYVPKAIEAAHG